MRIAYFAYSDLKKPGAARIHVSSIIEGMLRAGHRVTLITPGCYPAPDFEGVDSVILKKSLPSCFGWSLAAAGFVRGNSSDFDVAYVRDFWVSTSLFRALGKANISSVLEVNGLVRNEKRGTPPRFRILSELDWAFSLTPRLRLADRVICVSPYLAELAAEKSGAPDQCRFLPNGVDIDLYSPGDRRAARRKLNLPAEAPIVGSVGSILKYHLGGPLPEIIESLTADYPDLIWLFVGGGDGEEELRGRLGRFVESGTVRFIGRVPVEESADYVNALDIAAAWSTPGSAMLGWPMRLAAYAACGVPMVGPDWPTYTYFAEKGALVGVKNGEASGYVRAICELLDNPKKAGEIGEAGRKYATEELSWGKIANETNSIINEIAP